VQSSVENAGFALGDRKDVQLEAFVTERFDVLFVTFALRYGATSASATDVDADTDSHIIVEGQCFYRPAAREVTAPRVDRIRFLTTADGQVHERKTVFGYMSAVLGAPPPVPHEIREPLPGASKFSVIELGDSAQE
jgi:hypothetical protein